jgi:glycine dehydrogenase subunit 1
MPYLYHTDEDRRQMLEALRLKSEDDLFEHIPRELRFGKPLAIGEGKSEFETLKYFQALAARNTPASAMASFLGGGIYDHVVPSVVRHLASRSEFYTAYTPYQAEVSQGTLQAIFEFQTLISRLNGMPVANASMYDGATALAEAALMATKITQRSHIVCAGNVNPRYRSVMATYAGGRDLTITTVPTGADGAVDAAALDGALHDGVAAVILQTPNYFGVLETPWQYERRIHASGALLVVSVDPCSLALLRPPGSYGADIAVGEGQSLGNDMNLGGPLIGFMTCREEHVRNLPGRLVSRTTDVDGKTGYVLTLQTREQHIRREKATSNICTNQGLLALRSTIYLSLLGETGFKEMSTLCFTKAHRLAAMIGDCRGYGLRYRGPFFREFVVRCPVPAATVVERAREAGVLAGIPLDTYFGQDAANDLLVAVTEKRTDEEFKRYCDIVRRVQ